MALDVGTSSVKCLIVDTEGCCTAAVSKRWASFKPAGAPDTAREFNPKRLLSLVRRAVGEALGRSGLVAEDVASVGITSQRQGVIALDETGKEVYAGPNMDLRAVFEGSAMDETHGDVIYDTTGHLPSFFFTPAKLKWLRSHSPRRYNRIQSVLSLADWVAYRLTGNLACEPSLAGEAGLLDIRRGAWCDTLHRELGVELPFYPPLRPAGTLLGGIALDVADSVGLTPDTSVAVGGADTQCGLLGMGVTSEGEAGLVAGWSAPVQQVSSCPVFSPGKATWTGLHVVPDCYVVESSTGVAGYALDWMIRAFRGRGAGSGMKSLERMVRDVPPGSNGVVALMGPSRMDMGRVGFRLGGIIMPVPTTHYGLDGSHMARAILENIAFAVKSNMTQIESITGRRAGRICVGGGMTNNAVFVQIIADVLGREVYKAGLAHVSGLGAAMAASVAGAAYDSLAEASEAMRGDLQCVEPDPATSAEYQDYYERWCTLGSNLEDMTL